MALPFTAHYCNPVFHKRCLDSTVFTWLGNVIQLVLWYWIQLHQAIQTKMLHKEFFSQMVFDGMVSDHSPPILLTLRPYFSCE